MPHPSLSVRVSSEFACFTRPEMKVERVSYQVMTPSAARGVLEAIFWKPEFRWVVREIQVLNPIRHFSMQRNELRSKAAAATAGNRPYFAEDDRTQRHTLGLRDVAYVIKADIVLQPHADANVAKYRDQFRRRVERGQCFQRPYLGCREFAAAFQEVDPDEAPQFLTCDLGNMLLDVLQCRRAGPIFESERRGIHTGHEDGLPCDAPRPLFFNAKLEDGVMQVPDPRMLAQEA